MATAAKAGATTTVIKGRHTEGEARSYPYIPTADRGRWQLVPQTEFPRFDWRRYLNASHYDNSYVPDWTKSTMSISNVNSWVHWWSPLGRWPYGLFLGMVGYTHFYNNYVKNIPWWQGIWWRIPVIAGGAFVLKTANDAMYDWACDNWWAMKRMEFVTWSQQVTGIRAPDSAMNKIDPNRDVSPEEFLTADIPNEYRGRAVLPSGFRTVDLYSGRIAFMPAHQLTQWGSR